uniref:Uncharacterized protein n=1 Tax=Ditylenchus dipsaci TaxID=166011 RepID=A0A915CSM1_9BILA
MMMTMMEQQQAQQQQDIKPILTTSNNPGTPQPVATQQQLNVATLHHHHQQPDLYSAAPSCMFASSFGFPGALGAGILATSTAMDAAMLHHLGAANGALGGMEMMTQLEEHQMDSPGGSSSSHSHGNNGGGSAASGGSGATSDEWWGYGMLGNAAGKDTKKTLLQQQHDDRVKRPMNAFMTAAQLHHQQQQHHHHQQQQLQQQQQQQQAQQQQQLQAQQQQQAAAAAAAAASFDALKAAQVYPSMNSWNGIPSGHHSPQSINQATPLNYLDPAMYGAYGRQAYDMMTYFSNSSNQYGQASPHSPAAAYHQQAQQQQQHQANLQQQQQQQQTIDYMGVTKEPDVNGTASAVTHLFRNHFGCNEPKDGIDNTASQQAAAMALAMGMQYNPAMWTTVASAEGQVMQGLQQGGHNTM